MDKENTLYATPCLPDFERRVLSRVMASPEDMDFFLTQGLTEDYFYVPAHRIIWNICKKRFDADKPVDIQAVISDLELTNQLEKVGGHCNVLDILATVPINALRQRDFDELKRAYISRKMLEVCQDTMQDVYEGKVDAADMLDTAERRIFAIRTDCMPNKETTFAEAMIKVVNKLERGVKLKGQPDGATTGFTELDRYTSGLHPGELFVIAGRPSMGKTAFMLNIVQNIIGNDDACALVFSLEMTQTGLGERLLHATSGVSKSTITDNQGQIPKGSLNELRNAVKWLRTRDLVICDKGEPTIGYIRAYARRVKREHPKLAVIAVDYLQLMRSNSKQASNSREREVAEISGGLKALAKELDVPVICLSQLNRAVESRTGKEHGVPYLSDLRDSGSIEQDADLVGLLHRPVYYLSPDDPHREEVANLAFLDLAKNRNGATGRIPLFFEAPLMRFSNAAVQYPETEANQSI